MERLIGAVLKPAFFSSNPVRFQRTSNYFLTRKIAPDIIHLLGKEGITQCVYHSPLIAYLLIKWAYT